MDTTKAPGTHSAPGPAQAATNRLEVEQRLLKGLHLSSNVISTILASRRASTIRIYGSTWRIFIRWCQERSLDPLLVTAESVLDFLQHGFKKGLKPATLRCQVAALDSIYSIQHHPAPLLSRQHLVQKFLRGATSLCPFIQRRFPSWHLHTVLRALMGPPFEPMAKVDLR